VPRAVIIDILGIANVMDIADIADIITDITDIMNIMDITVETGRRVQGVTEISCNSVVEVRTEGVVALEGKIVVELSQTIGEIGGRAKSYPLLLK
jgi:hypothetical protein